MAKERDELWRGQKAEAMKARLMGASKGGEKPQSFNGRDQKTLADLEQHHNQFLTGKPSVQERMAQRMQKADKAIKERIAQSMTEADDDQQQAYIDRIEAFDRQMGLMPEKPRSQVEKVAAAIKQEFNLDGKESIGTTASTSTINPEVLLTSATKNLLKTFNPESLVLAPAVLALMVVKAMSPEAKAAIKKFYDRIPVRFRRSLVFIMATVVLAACSSMSGTPTREVDVSGTNDSPAGEQADLPSAEATEEAGEQATEEALTEEVNQFPISYSPAEDNPYVQISQEQNENQEEGAAFMDAIGENGLGLISTSSNNLYRNNYNIFYAFNDKEGENSDQAIFNLTQKDSSGKETYLYATLEGGIACAKNLNSSFDATGAHLSFDANNGIIATLLDGDNKAICGLELTSRQWKPLDADGNLINPSGEVIATPTSINDPNRDKSPVLTSDPEVIKAINDRILAGEKIDTSKMTSEQQTAVGTDLANRFLADHTIDLSALSIEQRNSLSKALAEIKNEEAGINFISFTYLKNEEFYLDPNTLSMEKMPANPDDEFKKQNSFEIYIDVETDEQGNITYSYNGKPITISAAGIDFRTEITDPNDPRIDWPDTDRFSEGKFTGLTYLQSLLADKSAGGNSKAILAVVHKDALGKIPAEVGPAFKMKDIFHVVQFETDTNGKPILAKVSILFPQTVLGLYEQGTDIEIVAGAGIKDYGALWKTLEDGKLYYVFTPSNPQAAINSGTFGTLDNIEGINKPGEMELLIVSSLMKMEKD